jgi:hypothetical protein
VIGGSLDADSLTAAGIHGGEAPTKQTGNGTVLPGEAWGIKVDPLTPEDTVTMTHTIISGVEGWCISSDGENPASQFQISHSNLHACGEDGDQQADNVALLEGMMYVDPLFVDPGNGDYHLSSGSPLIDMGLSGVEQCPFFELEPEPNGCAANLGAYSNTPEAATKANAEHCVCE